MTNEKLEGIITTMDFSNESDEGSIRQEGDLFVGDGTAGMQMFDDTMNLAISKTAKTGYTARTILSTAISAAIVAVGYKFENPYIGLLALPVVGFAVKNGLKMKDATHSYNMILDEAVSHGWAPREHLKQIDYKWL